MASKTHYRACNLCEAICGLEIEVDGATIQSIRGDKKDPLSKGYICPKAMGLKDIYLDKDRLKKPVKRIASGWVEISWEEAYAEVVENLIKIQKTYGRDSIGLYLGNPVVHNSGTMLSGSSFYKTLKTKYKYSATSVDQLPHKFVSYFMFGHQLLLPVPDIDRTQFLLILGGNPLASNGSMMTAPGVKNRLKAIQGRGGKVVLMDPRKTETSKIVDEHFFIKPGTDVYLLLGLVAVIFEEGLVDLGNMASFTKGLETVEKMAKDFSLDRIATITGIPAEEIRTLAKDFCAAETAVVYGRMGVSTQTYGGLCQWLVYVINIITGNFDKAGGAMFTSPALNVLTSATKGNRGRWHSKTRKVLEFSGELPVSTLAEDILNQEGEEHIKAMVVVAGNPVLSTPNGNQLEKAFESLDFMVSIDIYINETSRFANIILPPTTGLETSHYDIIFNALSVRNTAKYSKAIFSPSEGAKHDYEIFKVLTDKMNTARGKNSLKSKLVNSYVTPKRKLDLGLKLGPYGKWKGMGKLFSGLSLRKLKKNPHGIDLGPLRSQFPNRLFTKDKKIALAPEVIMEDVKRVLSDYHALANKTVNGELYLIGRRSLRTNNSWMHNSERLVKNNLCTLLMHPDDAVQHKINNKDMVTVASKVGKVTLPVEVTDEVMQGVVCIPHGWGHNRENTQMKVANLHAGVSINDLTDDAEIDELTGNAVLNGVPVKVYV
jgi:anaerobic selenocysteine-containing dehydrogenase